MTKFSENIVGRIKSEHIVPVPRWHFLLKSYVFWGLLAISVFLGSISFSVIAHLASVGDFDLFGHLQGNFAVSAMMMLPYFWFLSVAIFGLVAYYNWKHTRLGYRFKRRWIFFAGIGCSVFFGSIMYAFGMGNAIDLMMIRSMPFYDQSKHKARAELWLQPESGLIMGRVVGFDGANSQVIIEDEQGRDWSIDEKAITQKIESTIKKGKIVKVIGKKDGESGFIAKEIRKCGDCYDDEATEIIKDDEDMEIQVTEKIKIEDKKEQSSVNDPDIQEKQK